MKGNIKMNAKTHHKNGFKLPDPQLEIAVSGYTYENLPANEFSVTSMRFSSTAHVKVASKPQIVSNHAKRPAFLPSVFT